MSKCDVCISHARWWNDRNESGCICRIGYDLSHQKHCCENTEVYCGAFQHVDPNQRRRDDGRI